MKIIDLFGKYLIYFLLLTISACSESDKIPDKNNKSIDTVQQAENSTIKPFKIHMIYSEVVLYNLYQKPTA